MLVVEALLVGVLLVIVFIPIIKFQNYLLPDDIGNCVDKPKNYTKYYVSTIVIRDLQTEESQSMRQTLTAFRDALSAVSRSLAAQDTITSSHSPLLLRPCLDQLRHVASQIQSNAFQLDAAAAGRPTGLAVYPLASFFNHSCVPTLRVYANASSASLVFVAPLAIEKGAELSIPYIEVEAPASARRQRLLARYHFLCRCEACQRGRPGRLPDSEPNSQEVLEESERRRTAQERARRLKQQQKARRRQKGRKR
eukprot:g60813.t1